MYKVYLPILPICLVCLLQLRITGGRPKSLLSIDMMLGVLKAGAKILSFFETAKTAKIARNTAMMLGTLQFSGKI